MASLRNPLFTLDAAPSQETMQALANDGKSSLRRGWEAGRLSTDINALAADEMSLRANGDVEGAENLRLQRQGLEAARAGVAPQVQSLAQVNSLGSGLDWLAGQVGQGTASMVEPIVAGGGIQGLGRLAGMTKTPLGRAVELATQFAAPATAYGINQRQLTGEFGADVMNDPTLAGKISAQELNRQANAYGLGAAALDTLPQMGMARRLVGAGTLRALDRMPLGARVGLDLAGEGTTEALQTGGSQLMKSGIDPNRDTSGDRQELIDSFAGGFVGAGPMSLASNAAQAGHDRLGKTADVIGEKAGDVADLATGTVTEAAQKGKGLLARAMGVFRRGEAAGEDLGDDAAPEAGKPQGSGVQFDKADIDYLNSVPEGVDPMDDIKSRVKMAQRYLPQFQDDPEAQDLLAQIQEGARAGDIDMLGKAVDAASTKIAQRHNQDDLIRRAEQGTPAEQLARIAGGLATRGVKAAAKGAFKVGKAAVEGVTAAATKKNMQGAEQTEGGLGDALGGYLADKASASPVARRSSKLPTHFKRLGEDLGDLIDSFERSPGKQAAGKAADKMRLRSMTPQLMRHAIAVARDMEAAFGRDAALTHVEEMQLLTKQGQPVFKALRNLLSDDQTRNLSAHMAQHEMQSAMEMVRLLPDKARAELAGSAQLRTEFLGAVDRVATGRATAKQRQLLEQAVGGPKVLNGLLSAYSGRLEDPEEQAEQGGEKTAAAIDDEDGEGESEQFGEDYEAGKQSGAEKALANGAAPKLYGFDRTPTLKAGTKERPDPFRGKDLPNLFDPERILHKQSPDDPDVRALDKRLTDMAEQLRLKGTEGDDGHRYQVSAKSALTVMKERGYTPEQVLDTYRRYRSKALQDALKSKDSPLSADGERALRKLLSDLSATLDAAVPTGTDPNALPTPKRLGLPDLKDISSYDELSSEERAAIDKDRRAGRMQTRGRFRRAITGASDLGSVSADRLRDLYASALEFFDYHKVAVAEQLSDRLVERMEPAELNYLVEKASRAVDFARKATADRFKDLVEAAPTAEPDEILAMQEEARLAGAEVFDNNNIITFESTTLATRGERKGKPALLHMRADDLARWAAGQRREQKSADFEKNAGEDELSDGSRDDQFLKDLASGIAAVMASGDVRDTMPYKITAVDGKVVKQRFTETSTPDSLTLPTETMGEREAARKARAEFGAEMYRQDRMARGLPMSDRRPMKIKRTIGLYEGGKKVGQKTALVDNPKRDQREWVGHQGAVARDQDSAPTGSDDSIDTPIDEGPIQTIQRTGLTALERAQLANIPTLAGRMRAFATKEADEAVAEARDVGPIRETDADMIADGAEEAAREIFSLTGVAAGKFNAAPRGAKTGNLGLSPLDFFDKLEAPETPDEFADQRYTSRTQGFDATAGARPMENKGQALAMAKSRGMELAQEGLDAIARRIRTARRDKTGDLVGAPHYIFAAAAALTGDNLSMMDLSASEMERAVDMRGEVATVLNEMAPKDALAGARLLFGSPNISLSQYRKMLAEEIDSSPTAVAARATKPSPAQLEAQKARREAEKARAEAKAEALTKDIAQFEDQLSKVKESLVRREDDDTAGRKADTLRADVLRMKIDRAQSLRAKALAKLDEAPAAEAPKPAAPKAEAPKPAAPARDPAYEKDVMDRLMNERYDFKTAAEVDKFLKTGYAMWQRGKAAEANLRKQRSVVEEAEEFDEAKYEQLSKALDMIRVLDETFAMGAAAHTDLGSFYDGVEGEWKDDKEARAMLKGAAPEVAAQAPKSQGAPSGGRSPALGGTGPYAAKDQAKSDQANKFIGRGSAASSTAKYAKAWGARANTGQYTSSDVVFVSAEGNRGGRIAPDLDEIGRAVQARATIITDDKANRDREYNVGEREVAKFLAESGYRESAPGRWTPSNPRDAQAPKSQGALSGGREGRHLGKLPMHYQMPPEAVRSSLRPSYPQGTSTARLMADGHRTATTRRPFGEVGDTFEVGGDKYRITAIERVDLDSPEGRKKWAEREGWDLGYVEKNLSRQVYTGAVQTVFERVSPRNAQTSTTAATGDNSQEAIARADAYLRKVLPGVRLEFANLTGYSGEWIEAENLIRISTVSAPGAMQTAYHEALHAFFSKFVKANPEAKRVLASLVNHGPTLDRLVALLNGHPAAQAQLADAEERLAYAYQFWAAGLLDLPGTSGKGFFAKVKKFLRRVAGAISDHERAADILIAFHEGKLAQPSAAGQAIGKIIAQGTMNLKARRKMDRTIQWAYSRVAPAETVLARSPSVTAQKLAKEMFTNPGDEGAAGVPEGYLNARRTSYTRFNNRMARIVKDLGERDTVQVLKYLQDEAELADIPFAPHREAVREIRKLLRDFYDYSVEKGVNLEDRGEKYFPIVWDFDKLTEKRAEFINLVTTKYGRDGEAIWNALTNVTDPARDNKRDPDRADGVLSPFFAGKEEVTLDFFEAADRQKFLQDTLVGTLSNYFHQGARNAEYTHRFGEKGEVLSARLNTISQELRKHAAAELAAGRFADKKQADEWAARQFQLVEDSVGAMEGSLGKDTAQGWRKATSWLTAYQNLRLLPLTLFASFVDPLGMVARGATMREAYDSFLRGMREVFTQWGDMFRDQPKQRQLDRWEKLAEDIGAVDAVMLSHHVAEEYSSGYMAPGAKRVNDWLFRLNGMEAWNRGMRVGATKAATRFIVQHATRPEFHSERWLKELNLTKDDVHLDADGELVLSPKALEATGMSKDQARETALKLRNALNRWVEGAVLTPNAAQRPAWASDPRWSFMFHLKQFSYSFHQTMLKRAVKEMNHGNLAPMGAFAWYVPAMMASDITKGLIQGGGSLPTHMQGWTLGDHVMHGIERAGFLGIGAVGVDASQDIWSLGGPAIEQVIDAMVDPAGQTVLRAMPLNGIYAELVR